MGIVEKEVNLHLSKEQYIMSKIDNSRNNSIWLFFSDRKVVIGLMASPNYWLSGVSGSRMWQEPAVFYYQPFSII